MLHEKCVCARAALKEDVCISFLFAPLSLVQREEEFMTDGGNIFISKCQLLEMRTSGANFLLAAWEEK